MESVVLADPDFDLAETSSPIMAAVPSMGQSGVSVKRTRLPVYFSRLLGTREEGEQIATLLGVSPWLSTGALEGRLKARRSPYVLHIATHGFFLPDHAWDEESRGRGLTVVPLEPAGILMRPSSPRLENPLLRFLDFFSRGTGSSNPSPSSSESADRPLAYSAPEAVQTTGTVAMTDVATNPTNQPPRGEQ
jgi:CHAT domain